jgi:hypothetical protein
MRFPIKITDNFLVEPIMHTFGAKPEVTYTELEGGKLRVRMGGWFDEQLGVDEIKAIAPSSWPWWGGLGVKLYHHGVGVIGSTDGVVNVKLKAPRKVSVALIPVECEQLWISLEDRDGFLKALAEATKLPISPHSPFLPKS